VITDRDRLAQAVSVTPERPRLVEVRTDRAANADLHRQIRRVVAAAVADA
jgi:hypothetical protein